MKQFFGGVIFGAIVVSGIIIEYSQHGWRGVGVLIITCILIIPFVILMTWLMEKTD